MIPLASGDISLAKFDPRNLILLLTGKQWLIALVAGAFCATILLPWYSFISPWIGCALFLSGVAVVHLHYSSRYIIPFPQFAILIAALQYVFAAWFGLYHPNANPTYFMGDRIVEYLGYAGPVVLVIAVGWAIGMSRLPPTELQLKDQHAAAGLCRDLDLLGLIGIAGLIIGNTVHIEGLGFVFVLLSNLRFVAVFGRMIVNGPGWQWRLAVVLGLEVIFATETAMFHHLLLWCLWTFAIWVYRFRPKLQTTLVTLAVAFLLLPPLQDAKWQLRAEAPGFIEEGEDPTQWSLFDKTIRWLYFLGPSIRDTITFQLDEDFLAEMAVRYNQGWIINRIMLWVPDLEPYARGETVISATKASLLPRFLSAEKARAGGRENMARFAGLELGEKTSMNLGFAGEMYANFGSTGGIIGCGVYALLIGFLFRVICKRAMTNPIWWSLVPFIFYAAVKAEEDVLYVLNWTIKGSAVLMGVIVFLPHFRRALFDRPARQSVSAVANAPLPPHAPTSVSALR